MYNTNSSQDRYCLLHLDEEDFESHQNMTSDCREYNLCVKNNDQCLLDQSQFVHIVIMIHEVNLR